MHPTPTLAALLLLLLLPSQAPAVEPSPVTEGYRAYRDQQWELAHSLWLPEAQRGDPRAQFYLSRLYSEGLGAMASRQEAFEWLSRSAQSGFAPAQYSLGNLHKNGHWVNTDRQIASEWYALAAEQGHRQAQYELALLLLERGDPGNMETGINWLKRAAIRADTAATRLLGELDIDPRAPRTKLSPEGMAKIGILISSRTASPEQNDTRRADTRTAPLGSTQQRDGTTKPADLTFPSAPPTPSPANGVDPSTHNIKSGNGGYTIQIATLSSPTNRDATVARARAFGPVYLIPLQRKGEQWHGVAVGRYATREEAITAADTIIESGRFGNIRPLVRKLESLPLEAATESNSGVAPLPE